MLTDQKNPFVFRKKACIGILLLSSILLLSGCAAQYGRIQPDDAVTRMFQTNSVPENYRYFLNGRPGMPYAIVGISPEYRFSSNFWDPVEPNTEDFARKVQFIWNPRWPSYTSGQGAHIQDRDGTRIGIWYSMYANTTISIHEDNRVDVYPPNHRLRD